MGFLGLYRVNGPVEGHAKKPKNLQITCTILDIINIHALIIKAKKDVNIFWCHVMLALWSEVENCVASQLMQWVKQ